MLGHSTDPAAIYYTMSTIAQTLAAAVALLAVFLVFLFQSYRGPMLGRMEELHNQSGAFADPSDRDKLELYWKMESFVGMVELFAAVTWPPANWRHIEKPLRVLQGYVALKRMLSHRFKYAAVACSVLIILTVALIPLGPHLAGNPYLAYTIMGLAVLAFAACIGLSYRVVVLALEKPTSTATTTTTTSQEAVVTEALEKRHANLLQLRQDSQQSYDRTLLTLSSGALALSLTFIKQLAVQGPPTWPLLAAWISWGLSLTAVLASHYFSGLALTSAIEHIATPGGVGGGSNTATKVLNALGGLLFLGGLACFIGFVFSLVR